MKKFSNLSRLYVDYIAYKLTMYYLVLLMSFSVLSLIVSLILIFSIFFMLLYGIFDVFMMKIMLEEISLGENLDVSYITDMSDIVDTTDLSDYIDYLSFYKSVYVREDKCLLYQYFDEFVKLFRNSNNSVYVNNPLHLINESIKASDVGSDYSGISKRNLWSEILRLNDDLYFCDKEIVTNWSDINENEKVIKELMKQIKNLNNYNRHLNFELSRLDDSFQSMLGDVFRKNDIILKLEKEINLLNNK